MSGFLSELVTIANCLSFESKIPLWSFNSHSGTWYLSVSMISVSALGVCLRAMFRICSLKTEGKGLCGSLWTLRFVPGHVTITVWNTPTSVPPSLTPAPPQPHPSPTEAVGLLQEERENACDPDMPFVARQKASLSASLELAWKVGGYLLSAIAYFFYQFGNKIIISKIWLIKTFTKK